MPLESVMRRTRGNIAQTSEKDGRLQNTGQDFPSKVKQERERHPK
jgi:hypothetical protein